MNWDDTRIFLALTRAPSLRAAARSLGVDQATVGRRLNALEAELGAKLFLRAKDGYLLTAAGETALAAARRMERRRPGPAHAHRGPGHQPWRPGACDQHGLNRHRPADARH